MAEEEDGNSTSELVPDGSFLKRETEFSRQYRDENEGKPKTISAAEELQARSTEDRRNLYHRNFISHLATCFWPSDLYMPARLGQGSRSDWSPYPTFGRFTVYFPEFLINEVNLWESGHARRDAAGAVLKWLNRYSDRLQMLDFDTRTVDSRASLGRLLGV